MYYVTHAIVEDVFVSLTHMSMNIMFLENVVGNLVNIITIDWPIQVGVFFVQLFAGTIVLNVVAKWKVQSYQNSNVEKQL